MNPTVLLYNALDLQRAEAILRSIVADLERPQELDQALTEEERESLGTLQSMLDIVQSPLFTAVVDITEKCKKVYSHSIVSWIATYRPHILYLVACSLSPG